MLKDFLQGKPFKHPLHPILVHYPIGLFVLSLLFDLAGWLFPEAGWLVPAAFYTMAGGVGMALLAAIPGLIDWLDIRADHPGKRFATVHMILNLVAVSLYVVNLLLRFGELNAETVPLIPVILSLIGVGLISISGYIGGLLIYDEGIAIGRYRRWTPIPRKTIKLAPSRSPDGFTPVASEDELDEGESLRVEINGEVMAITKLNGEVYAFNEFCTHRFGPLSEGAFHDGTVECPWHRSCFDVRTGKVVSGPAKVDIKTYKVMVREGKIQVRVK
jgi:nitrite reductase/ring-hydroxylating ferredoxin subunit/uncharacterized membrane protein